MNEEARSVNINLAFTKQILLIEVEFAGIGIKVPVPAVF